MNPKKVISMAGHVYGLLRVIELADKGPFGSAQWKCQCACGNTCVVSRPYLIGQTKCSLPSCGCKAYEGNRKVNKRQGTSTYRVWLGIRRRCNNPNETGYENYGGRGITYCPEWDDYENFLRDMGEKPKGMTIERINNDGNYEKANCKWATAQEQCSNRRSNRKVTIQGVTKCAREWDRFAGFKLGTISDRLKHGWPPERLLEPIQSKSKSATPR